jgi:hypothetical protein
MGYFLVWFLLAFIPAIIASKKGRSGLRWFVVSLFFSPIIAGIVVACLPSLKEELEQKALAEGGMRKCPFCAELVKQEATLCRYCHSELPPFSAPPSSPSPGMADGPMTISVVPAKCPNCGSDRMIALIHGRRYHCQGCSADFHVQGV